MIVGYNISIEQKEAPRQIVQVKAHCNNCDCDWKEDLDVTGVTGYVNAKSYDFCSECYDAENKRVLKGRAAEEKYRELERANP